MKRMRVNKENKYRITKEIVIYFILFVAIVLMILLLSIDYYWRVKKSLVSDICTLYRESAKNIAYNYGNLAENVVLYSKILSNTSYIQDIFKEDERARFQYPHALLRQRLELLINEFGGAIDAFQLYDRQKRLVFTYPDLGRENLPDREAIKGVLSDVIDDKTTFIHSYEIIKKNGEYSSCLLFATPVFSSDSSTKVTGILCIRVDLDCIHREYFSETNYRMKLVEVPETFLLSETHNVIFHKSSITGKGSKMVPSLIDTLPHAFLNYNRLSMPGDIEIKEGNDSYYVVIPVNMTVKSKKEVIKGPTYFILFVLQKSLFRQHLSSSVLFMVIASSLLIILLVMPAILIFKTLYKYEKERNTAFERELKIAYDIQVNFLPDESVTLKGFDVFCKSIPAREVGGDFYDIIPLSGDSLYLVIGDASGKGVPGALMMTVGKTLINFVAQQESDPVEVLHKVNRFISSTSESGLFFTAMLCHLNVQNKVLTYVLAGHNPPILCREGTVQEISGGEGSLMGCFPEIQVETQEIELKKNDIIVFYTDGLTDVWNDHRELIKEEEIWKTLLKSRHSTAQDIASDIFRFISEFQGQNSQFDDRTIIIIKVTE
ncbi:MAG: SpoIIE family protein phosphatase [Vulcanimicrobiota bacterium]